MDEKTFLMEYDKAMRENPLYPLEECIDIIEDVMEDDLVRLYDDIDNFIFQDIDYVRVISMMPQWIADAGISPELNYSKEEYEKLRTRVTHPIFGKFIYYYDLWTKVSAIQDRLSAVVMFMRDFYSLVPCKAQFCENQYSSAARCGGEQETQAHMLLNSIFVSFASIFDIISKVAVEQFRYGEYNFEKYSKMKSSGVLYNKNLRYIDSSLKAEGMLFSEPLVIKKIETFRNEFVHNGPWDLRCCVYATAVNGEPADTIIYSPDMDENGNFITSGSRNKFYSQANRINIQLPDMIKEATKVLKNTINQLSNLYKAGTLIHINEEETKKCITAIKNYYEKL